MDSKRKLLERQRAVKELNLEIENLIDLIAKHFRLYDVLDWLDGKLKKVIK